MKVTKLGCLGCGAMADLTQLAHFGPNGVVAGIIHICNDCLSNFLGKHLLVQIVDKQPEQGTDDKLEGGRV